MSKKYDFIDAINEIDKNMRLKHFNIIESTPFSFEPTTLKAQPNLETGTWVTQSNQQIKVTEMSDEHIYNTMKMLERNYPNGSWCKKFQEEYKKRQTLDHMLEEVGKIVLDIDVGCTTKVKDTQEYKKLKEAIKCHTSH